MGLSSFSYLELIQGSIGIFQLSINTILGSRIVAKYRTFRKRELVIIGLMLIFITSPWWGSASAFLSILFFINFDLNTMY